MLSKAGERFIDRFEQKGKHHFFVLQNDRVELVRKREDAVEVWNRQEFLLPLLNPLFLHHRLTLRTMSIPAGVVRWLLPVAFRTNIQMTLKRRGSADLNQVHDAADVFRLRAFF